MSDKTELLPCPFCGGDAASDAHAEDCYFSVTEAFKAKAIKNADMSLAPAVMRAWNRRAAIAQQPAPVAVPDGFRLVPVETTIEMEDAGRKAASGFMRLGEAGRVFRAMLAAAPEFTTPAAPVAVGMPAIPEQMVSDLARFNETCEDGQEYDVPKDRMRAMARFGLVRWCGGSRFELTDCGLAALEAMSAPPAAEQPPKAPMHPGVHYGCCPHTLATNSACRECRDKYGAGFDYRQPSAAEQPDAVKVDRELLRRICADSEHAEMMVLDRGKAIDELRALLTGGDKP